MKDKISALLDGDLDECASGAVLDTMRHEPDLKARWDDYCLIGDVLRGENSGATDFTARVMAGLEIEPTVLAPMRQPEGSRQGFAARSLMPIAASIMGVVAVGWVAHTLSSQPEVGVTLAGVSNTMRVEAIAPVQGVALAQSIDPRREYVLMHQATTGGGPLSGAMQYVRTVSETQGDRLR